MILRSAEPAIAGLGLVRAFDLGTFSKNKTSDPFDHTGHLEWM